MFGSRFNVYYRFKNWGNLSSTYIDVLSRLLWLNRVKKMKPIKKEKYIIPSHLNFNPTDQKYLPILMSNVIFYLYVLDAF